MTDSQYPPGQHPASPDFLKDIATQNPLLSTLWETSPLGILLIVPGPDDKNPILIGDCNPVTCAIHGQTRDDMVGQSMDLLHDIPWTPTVDRRWLTSPKIGDHLKGFSRHKRKDQTSFTVEYSLTFLSINGVRCAIGHDRIVDEKSAEEAAKHGLANRWINAMEFSEESVWEIDLAQRSMWTSARWQSILDFPQREEIRPLADILASIHAEDRKHFERSVKLLADDQSKTLDLEFRLRNASGQWIWLQIRGKASYTSDGRPDKVLGSMTNVTERKKAEEEIKLAKQKAEDANLAKSQFLAAMSHEIRTPMNGVLGVAALLSDTNLDEIQQAYLKTISDSGDSLLTIIDEILNFSKLEAGGVRLENEPFDLIECAYQALEVIRPIAAEKGLELHFSVHPQTPREVVGDQTRLRQIIINILGNAVKFTDEGEVELSLKAEPVTSPDRDPNLVNIVAEIKDTGIGIQKHHIDILFAPFTQADASTTRKFGGTGLGLAICKSLLELMGGSISVKSEIGKGSTFRCTAKLERKAANTYAAIPQLLSKQALIIAQNSRAAAILTEALQALGLGTTRVESLSAALETLANNPPYACAFVDLGTESETTIPLAKSIRIEHSTYPLPLIAIAAIRNARPATAEKGIFNARLLNPISPIVLAKTIRTELLGEKSVAATPIPNKSLLPPGETREEQILIVEDNKINQIVTVQMLNKYGYEPDLAQNGFEALDHCIRKSYDIIFMDIQMPGMNGYETFERICQRLPQGAPKPYVIALTAGAMEGDREICLASGMDHYVSKPMRPNHLEKALAHAREQIAQRRKTAN